MLVVSNFVLTTQSPVMDPSTFLGSSVKGFTLNINHDYRYLKTGYYVSLHAEVLGNPVIPTSENIIDSSRTPILLLRASKAGIPKMPFLVTDSVKKVISEIGFPLVVFAVNPFIHEGFKTAKNKSALYRAIKSLGMNYKFPVCALPLKGKMESFNSFFGKCDGDENCREISKRVFKLFRIPVCKLHVQKHDGQVYLAGLQPLKREDITSKDLKTISDEAKMMSSQGEPFGV